MVQAFLAADGTAAYGPFIESHPYEGPQALRDAMTERGYLFFRELIPVQDVLALRRDVLTLCREAGWLDSERDLMDAVIRADMQPTMEGQSEYNTLYRRILTQLPRFHAFPTHPCLMDIAATLLHTTAASVLVHPRRIGRITFPNLVSATTPAHQDHFYIRGTLDTYSCWAPVGDCPMELGGLAVAPGTHHAGFREHTEKYPAAVGGRGISVGDLSEWHTVDYAAGDALFFHSCTIHKALPNRTPNRLRLSTDNRYQREDDSIDASALRTHLDL